MQSCCRQSSDDCLLLTNTSSLDIAEIFADVPNKERCFGMHFFYPVKLTGFVELNVLPETSQSNAEKAAQLVKSAGKKPIVFSGDDPFEVLDSVGLGLMAGSPDNFRIERNKGLLGYGCEKMNGWLAEGCPKETLSFLDFMAERESASGRDCGKAALYMAALILNETVNAAQEYSGDTELFIEAVQDTLGLAEAPAYYYDKFGAKSIFASS